MDIWTLALFLDDLHPSMEIVDGRIFLDRKRLGREALLNQIKDYPDLMEAQKLINMVPVDDFLSDVVDRWDASSVDVEPVREIYERSWRAAAQIFGAHPEDISVKVLRDAEVGDLIFQLEQRRDLT